MYTPHIVNLGIPKEPLKLSVSTIDNGNPLTIPKQTYSQIRGKRSRVYPILREKI